MITFKTSVSTQLPAMPSAITPERLAKLGSGALVIILQRTTKGRDVHGHEFRPYSDRWGKYRAKQPPYEKRSGSRRQIGHVDLNFSGRMLGSLQIRVDAAVNRVTLSFPPSEAAKAHGNHFRWGREFFALSQGDLKRLGGELVKPAETTHG